MKDRICLILFGFLLFIVCAICYKVGIHSEKIGWLEDRMLDKKEVLK